MLKKRLLAQAKPLRKVSGPLGSSSSEAPAASARAALARTALARSPATRGARSRRPGVASGDRRRRCSSSRTRPAEVCRGGT